MKDFLSFLAYIKPRMLLKCALQNCQTCFSKIMAAFLCVFENITSYLLVFNKCVGLLFKLYRYCLSCVDAKEIGI